MRAATALVLLGLLQMGPASGFAAEPLGRLFYTPAQRAQLDTARSQKSRASLPSDEEAAPLPETITYSGMVRRNDGKSTIWLNNRAVNDGKPAEGVPVIGRVRPDGRIVLDSPQGGARTELKVGQSLEIVSGTIEEPYARRATAPKAEAKPKPGVAQKAEPAAQPRRDRDNGGSAEPANGAIETGTLSGARRSN